MLLKSEPGSFIVFELCGNGSSEGDPVFTIAQLAFVDTDELGSIQRFFALNLVPRLFEWDHQETPGRTIRKATLFGIQMRRVVSALGPPEPMEPGEIGGGCYG